MKEQLSLSGKLMKCLNVKWNVVSFVIIILLFWFFNQSLINFWSIKFLGKFTKAPITLENMPALVLKVKDFQNYWSLLKKQSGQLLLDNQQKTGFFALFCGLETLLGLGTMLLSKVPENLTAIKYLISYRLSQDHL